MTRDQARYREFKAAGVCTRCGARKPAKGKTRCGWCKAKQNRYIASYRARKAAEGIANG